MNFKKNVKRFFTLSRNAEGFTLVELIVVIAILGILTTVALPAYGTYVESANKAADQRMLSVINGAFAVACAGNHVDTLSLVGADLDFQGKGTAVTGVKSITGVDNDTFGKIQADFNTIYVAENPDATFKVTDKIIFNNRLGLFVTDGEMIALQYGGGTVYMDPADVAALIGTTFTGAEGLGVYGVLDQVHNVTSMVGGSKMEQVYNSAEFKKCAALALDLDPNAPNLDKLLQDKVAELATKNGGNANQIRANAAVLFAAQNATKMTNGEITSLLKNPESYDNILNEFTNNDPAEGLAQASLVYGMYLAYAHSSYGNDDAIANAQNPKDALVAWDNLMNPAEGDAAGQAAKQEFLTYVDSTQGQKDLEGYLSALNMINSSTGDPKAVENLMINGFGDDALAALVKGELDKIDK